MNFQWSRQTKTNNSVLKHWQGGCYELSYQLILYIGRFHLSYWSPFEFTMKKLRWYPDVMFFFREYHFECSMKLKFEGNWNNMHECWVTKLWNLERSLGIAHKESAHSVMITSCVKLECIVTVLQFLPWISRFNYKYYRCIKVTS